MILARDIPQNSDRPLRLDRARFRPRAQNLRQSPKRTPKHEHKLRRKPWPEFLGWGHRTRSTQAVARLSWLGAPNLDCGGTHSAKLLGAALSRPSQISTPTDNLRRGTIRNRSAESSSSVSRGPSPAAGVGVGGYGCTPLRSFDVRPPSSVSVGCARQACVSRSFSSSLLPGKYNQHGDERHQRHHEHSEKRDNRHRGRRINRRANRHKRRQRES